MCAVLLDKEKWAAVAAAPDVQAIVDDLAARMPGDALRPPPSKRASAAPAANGVAGAGAAHHGTPKLRIGQEEFCTVPPPPTSAAPSCRAPTAWES